jgi:hypothetical protein
MRDFDDLVAIRTVVIQFPGRREYWLTEKEFTVGETIERNGRAWNVSEVLGSGETGGNPRIRLTERRVDLDVG